MYLFVPVDHGVDLSPLTKVDVKQNGSNSMKDSDKQMRVYTSGAGAMVVQLNLTQFKHLAKGVVDAAKRANEVRSFVVYLFILI